jgi:phage terminase large subunit-like protein
LTVATLDGLSAAEQRELYELLDEKERRQRLRKMFWMYPEVGPLRRELYRPHMEFFEAGAHHRQRIFMAPNRVGKTEGVYAYEIALHLTGRYPAWWKGKRFHRSVRVWAVGKTSETVRDTIQRKLIGAPGEFGTGMIPGEYLDKITRSAGIAELADTVYVKNVSGKLSVLTFKSYDQGRRAFEGHEVDVVGMDEEPPLDIYTECLVRTMTTDGIVLCTFTPLLGVSETVLFFLGGGVDLTRGDKGGGRYLVTATWDDAPHLTEPQKKELEESIPPYQRDARVRGIPQLGSGAIYPVAEDDVIVKDFPIPEHWPKGYGMDVGWNKTAAIWGAKDHATGTIYLYGEYARGQSEPIIHVTAIKARGDWMRGEIDPASRGRGQQDGKQLFEVYTKLGLHLNEADNAVDAGLATVWELMSTGRLKIFKSLTQTIGELRLYRRDDKGRVVKQNDHLMDAMRYLIMSGMRRAGVKPSKNLERGGSQLVMRR